MVPGRMECSTSTRSILRASTASTQSSLCQAGQGDIPQVIWTLQVSPELGMVLQHPALVGALPERGQRCAQNEGFAWLGALKGFSLSSRTTEKAGE